MSALVQLETQHRLVAKAVPVKVTKAGAGYVQRDNTDYRCNDCWKWIAETEQCAEARPQDIARSFGSCILWAMGTPVPDLQPSGAYSLDELGYTEDKNGTKCKRCKFFDVEAKRYCTKVDEKSEGDTPGEIDPNGCCANQLPRNPTLLKFDDDQPRDEHGRWTSGGSDGSEVRALDSKDQEIIHNYVQLTAPMSAASGLLKEHGKAYDSVLQTSDKGDMRMCYMNAYHLMMAHPEYTYVEGLALPNIKNLGFPIEHAWVVNSKGQVIDPTWKDGKAYFGIPFNKEYVMRTELKTKVYGVLSHTNLSLLQGKDKDFLQKVFKFDDSEARDEHGRWSSGGSASVGSAIEEIHERFPANPANPSERVLNVNGKPALTFEVAEREGRLRLKTMQAFEPNQGVGSVVLNRLTRIADKHGVTMELTSAPFGDDKNRISHEKLQSWYESHGFHLESGFDPALGYMVREPRVRKFDEDEARDDHGRWTSGGASGGGTGDYALKEVRPATKEDLEAIRAAASGNFAGRAETAKEVLGWLLDYKFKSDKLVAVAKDGTLLGAVSYIPSVEGNWKVYTVAYLAVNPRVLSGQIEAHGTGTRLMQEIAQRAAPYNAEVMLRSADSESDKFYSALGMHKTGSDSFHWSPEQTAAVAKEFALHKSEAADWIVAAEEQEKLHPPLAALKPLQKYSEDEARDDHGRWTASGEHLLPIKSFKDAVPEHITSLRIPPAWTGVMINPNPKGDLMAVGVDAKGRSQGIYSQAHWENAAAAKFARVKAMEGQYEKMMQQNASMAKSDPEHAAVVALVAHTGIRPGSDSDTKADKQAYGATTLLGKHVVVNAKGDVNLKFVGKKGVDLTIPIEDKKLAAAIVDRAKKAGSKGKLFNVTDDSLRDYVHKLGGGNFKPKDFRTLLANKLAVATISASKAPSNEKEYTKAVKEVAKVVAARLGNTPTVALASYINPVVFTQWRSHARV